MSSIKSSDIDICWSNASTEGKINWLSKFLDKDITVDSFILDISVKELDDLADKVGMDKVYAIADFDGIFTMVTEAVVSPKFSYKYKSRTY